MKNFKSIKSVGIWMDHAEAKLLEPGQPVKLLKIVHSPVKSHVRINGEEADGTRLGNYRSTNNESHKHYREQNELHAFYKNLLNEIEPYDEVFIFGPTKAHNEFENFLFKEKHKINKTIHVKNSDYITDNQIAEQIRLFFEKK